MNKNFKCKRCKDTGYITKISIGTIEPYESDEYRCPCQYNDLQFTKEGYIFIFSILGVILLIIYFILN